MITVIYEFLLSDDFLSSLFLSVEFHSKKKSPFYDKNTHDYLKQGFLSIDSYRLTDLRESSALV